MVRPGKMIRQLLRSFFKKVATVKYPQDKSRMPKGFRGRLKFDAEKCVGCLMCMKDCPSNAINIVKAGEKQFEAHIDLSRCIYCGQCVDSCFKKALGITGDFELASLDKEQLKIIFHAGPKTETQSSS